MNEKKHEVELFEDTMSIMTREFEKNGIKRSKNIDPVYKQIEEATSKY